MDTQEKKFFTPILRTYNNDLSKRWRFEWEVPIYNGLKSKKVVYYGGINRGKTIAERIAYANTLLEKLNLNGDSSKPKNSYINSSLEKVIQINTINWRASSLRVYKTVSRVFNTFLNGVKYEEVTPETIRDFVLYLKEGGASQHKIYKYLGLLKSIYTKAVELGFVSINPIPKLGLKKSKPRSLLFFSDAQIECIKQAKMPQELWLSILLLYYCFIRPGEARLLKIADINFQYGFIEIPAEVSKNKKTQKVSIPVNLKNSLDYLSKFPENNYLLGIDGIPQLNPLPEKRLYRIHTRILKELNINGRYSLYSWKHTGVVKAVKAGINIKDLQLQLRHHSLDMVNEYLKNLGVLDSNEIKNNFPSI